MSIEEKKVKSLFEEGHYYHPLPDFKKMNEQFYEKNKTKHLFDVNLNPETQQYLITEFVKYYKELPPWQDGKSAGLDYYFATDNNMYQYGDAISLYSMIRQYKPQRIIEIGSGHSTAVMSDVNRLYFENKINITCIEPYCDRIKNVLGANIAHVHLHEHNLQDVPVAMFKELKENDILFVDSSHTSKFGSDLNKIIFEILPLLDKGVVIHFHDIFQNFEYPYEWLKMGIGWNEAYLLHAFLMYNTHFQILLHSSYVHSHFADLMKEHLPLTLKNMGASLWIQKTTL